MFVLCPFHLICIVPPQPPRIYGKHGIMQQDRIGPLVEGTDLTLICSVHGGTPTPQLTWMSRGRQLPGTSLNDDTTAEQKSKLVIKNLSRIHQLAVYSCHASNFPRTSVSTNVTIELTRKQNYSEKFEFLFCFCTRHGIRNK